MLNQHRSGLRSKGRLARGVERIANEYVPTSTEPDGREINRGIPSATVGYLASDAADGLSISCFTNARSAYNHRLSGGLVTSTLN